MILKKILAVSATATLAVAGLTACGDTADDTARNVTEAVTSPVDAATDAVATEATDVAGTDSAVARSTEDDATTGAAGAGAAGAPSELPASITGYTAEAQSEMAEDNITEADVEAVLEAARNGQAEVEWDDGYWEIEWQDIDIDIDPAGMVLEADR